MARTFSDKMVNAFNPDSAQQLGAEDRRLIERRGRILGPAYRLFYEEPIHIVRGEGVWLYDVAGNAYLDVYNNVAAVGHCHPRVVDAISQQARTLNTHTRYLHETILDYGDRLLSTFPNELSHVMLTCTGSEANDLALRIAKAATGNTGVIVTNLAYHGVTEAISQISPSLGPDVERGSHVRTVPAPDLYRSGGVDVGSVFAAHVERAIRDLESQGIKLAAMFCDSIFSSDGIMSDPPGFLKEAVSLVRRSGGVFVADEVQSGFGRTGQSMWGFARHGFVPDIVTIGKSMGNGHPIAGVVMRPEVVEDFGRKSRYFNTFGGNPVSCAAALATLEVIEDEGLMENARTTGAYLMSGLRDLATRHAGIGDVRGCGLFVGVEFVSDRDTKMPDAVAASHLVNELRRQRILISATGPGANILKVRPPLVFTPEHADRLVHAIDGILEKRVS